MEAALPTLDAIQEIESRQEEVLRKLEELEKQVLKTLAEYGDPARLRTWKIGDQNPATIPFPSTASAQPADSLPAVKVA